MQATVRIQRYNPESDRAPHIEEYALTLDPLDRVLDALNRIKWEQDGTLTYRRSCGHGVCGSDAMRIDGRNRLACKVLMQDVGSVVTIEPLIGFRVMKDLVVDMEPFFAQYRTVKPYLMAEEAPTHEERRQSIEERARFDDTSKCILCAACTSSCPITWPNTGYVGPAAIVNAHRFIFDSRDEGAGDRLRILNGDTGVWRCRTIFNCTEVCPRGIEVTRAIGEVKRAALYDSTEDEQSI